MIELFASVVDSAAIERALGEVVVEDVTRDRIPVGYFPAYVWERPLGSNAGGSGDGQVMNPRPC
jgi:hypothetical protein